jgi:hypothetical protein
MHVILPVQNVIKITFRVGTGTLRQRLGWSDVQKNTVLFEQFSGCSESTENPGVLKGRVP